jgi:hypothetical protein
MRRSSSGSDSGQVRLSVSVSVSLSFCLMQDVFIAPSLSAELLSPELSSSGNLTPSLEQHRQQPQRYEEEEEEEEEDCSVPTIDGYPFESPPPSR